MFKKLKFLIFKFEFNIKKNNRVLKIKYKLHTFDKEIFK